MACSGGERTIDAGPVDSYEKMEPRRIGPLKIYVVRMQDDSFIALYAANTHVRPDGGPAHGCTVPWRPDFRFLSNIGWFREPCGGATFDATGHRVFGPAESDLDRFPVEVRDGNVYVDTSRLICQPRQYVHCKVDGLTGG